MKPNDFGLVYAYQSFCGIFSLLLHISSSTLNMEAVSFSKTLVPLYEPTRRIFPEDWGIHQYCSESLKSC